MYPLTLGQSFFVQQRVASGGVFDGTEQGRAKVDIGTIPAQISVYARRLGAAANAYEVNLLDPGTGIEYPATTLTQSGTDIDIRLRRTSGGGIQATALEVSNVINAAAARDLGFPVVARPYLTGSAVMAAGSGTLAGGFDPTEVVGEFQFKWDYNTSTNGGLFHFEHEDALIIRQFEASVIVGATQQIKFDIVNLDTGLQPILGTVPDDSITVYENYVSPAQPEIAVSDVRIMLLPRQAFRVTCPTATGLVRVYVRREARFPYL